MHAFVVELPFELRSWGSYQGVRWDKEHRVSVIRADALPPALAPFAPPLFSWGWQQQAIINGGHIAPAHLLSPPFTARPHQKEASGIIQKAHEDGRLGFLLADEVGVGKTMSIWDALICSAWAKTILIVTTASATAHWRNTIRHAGWRPDQAILVINYDRLDKLFAATANEGVRRRGRKKRIARSGQAPAFDAVVFDEAHKGKNLTSARSVMMQKLSRAAGFTIWASATAGQNPLELAYLAPLLAQVTGSSLADLADFERWCTEQGLGVRRGEYGKWEWDGSPEASAKVKSWLFDGALPLGLRRLPQDIAGWPAMERQVLPVELDGASRQAYQQAWEEFCRERLARNAPKSSVQAARLRFRQKSSWLRAPSTVDLVMEELEKGRRVAVSVYFSDTAEEMLTRLRAKGVEAAHIHGKLTPAQKEHERLRFQKGQVPVVLFTVEEAISLHQGEYEDVPRTLLVHDLRWSAIQMAQIEGRCHRDGRFAPSIWLYAEATVEEDLVQVLLSRVLGMKGMHGDPPGDLLAIEEVLSRWQAK